MIKNDIFHEIFQIADDGLPEFKAYFDGSWTYGEEFFEIKSPIDNEIIARASLLNKTQISSALDSIYRKGRSDIRNFPGEKRVNSFLKAASLIEQSFEDFVNVLIEDAGKPHEKNAIGEVKATIERLEKTTMESARLVGEYIPGDWSDETLETEGIVKREPYGVVLTIGPYNYPLFIPATKITPALLVGNSVVLKPASADPIAPLMLTRILEVSGFPKKSFCTLTLRGRDSDLLIQDSRINAISFTGSTGIGTEILKKAGIKAYHLELGGKDTAIVLEDVDLLIAVDKLIKGMYSFSGQRCDAIRLILAEFGIYKKLKQLLIEEIKQLSPKNPLEDSTALMGPLIDMKSAEYVEEIYRDAITQGARTVVEFKRTDNYVWPILLETSKEMLPNLRAFREDVFGPITIITEVKDEDEAIEIANSSEFGLDASIFGSDDNRIRKISRKLQVGAVFINEYPRHGIGYYPFGGMKQSGIGREGIGYSAFQLTTTKTIMQNFKGYGVWEYL